MIRFGKIFLFYPLPCSAAAYLESLSAEFRHFNSLLTATPIERISNVSLEYLITSAVATTSIEAFVSYLLPIVVISVVVIAATTWVSIFFSKRWCPQDWFASAVAQYGAYMGLLSTGLLLAKVVDPDHKTVAAETVAASCTLGYSYSLPYLLIMPMLVISSPKLVFGISVVLLIVFLIAGEVFRKRARVSN